MEKATATAREQFERFTIIRGDAAIKPSSFCRKPIPHARKTWLNLATAKQTGLFRILNTIIAPHGCRELMV